MKAELQVPEDVLDGRPLHSLLGQAPQADLHDRPQRLVGASLAHLLVGKAPPPHQILVGDCP
uniref:Uncharacterized protein n=1 Tax=Oryza meridionalis TaxID=40149 RepID=A0A0E0D828_9ORYZ